MKILVLGHKGMLGNMVYKYLSTKNDCELFTTDLRWPTKEFKKFVIDFCEDEYDAYVINCIGAIHQRTTDFDVNIDLPIWLDKIISTIGFPMIPIFQRCKVIHPGTDCEIDNDEYGKSKRKIAEYLKENGMVTKTIKTSIVGTEVDTKASLLEWFLNTDEKEINGWSEYYWNGNTTLQWSKICYELIKNWREFDEVTIPATECISKCQLLEIMKEIYQKDIVINKSLDIKVNKCLTGNIKVPTIREQLIELKEFT